MRLFYSSISGMDALKNAKVKFIHRAFHRLREVVQAGVQFLGHLIDWEKLEDRLKLVPVVDLLRHKVSKFVTSEGRRLCL